MAKRKKTSRIKKANTAKWGRPADGAVKVTHINATISIPSGKCPVTLEDNDRESIRNWIVKITENKPSAHTYLASVYKYWVRDFYDSFSKEYREIGDIIDTIVLSPISKISDIGA